MNNNILNQFENEYTVSISALPKSVSFGIFLLFLLLLFGIPVLVGFVQDGTCVFLGM